MNPIQTWAGYIFLGALAVLIVAGIWRGWKWANAPLPKAPPSYCVRCGAVAAPVYYDPGSGLVELFFWLLALLPGLLYHLWRQSNSRWQCRECGGSELIPPESPRARELAVGR